MMSKKEMKSAIKSATSAKAGSGLAEKRLPENFWRAALKFQQAEADFQRTLRNVAFGFAGAAGVIAAVCGVVAAEAINKEPEPITTILEHDKVSGATTVLRGLRGGPISFDEATKRERLRVYVETCESYDWWTIQATADVCKLMSSPRVAAAYMERIQKPDAPLAVLKDRGKVIAKEHGITFLNDNVAQVRYTLNTYDMNTASDKPAAQTEWIETISFEINPTRKMTEAEREINSVGFTALTTRNDKQVTQ